MLRITHSPSKGNRQITCVTSGQANPLKLRGVTRKKMGTVYQKVRQEVAYRIVGVIPNFLATRIEPTLTCAIGNDRV
jgi:hypothetical protein